MCTRSMLNFAKYHPNSIITTNAYKLEWFTNYNGIIVVVSQVLQVPISTEETEKELDTFIHWMELYSFNVFRGKKWSLPNREIKQIKWTPTKILRRFYDQVEIKQGYGSNIREFISLNRRNNDTINAEYIEHNEEPNDELRQALNRLYNL